MDERSPDPAIPVDPDVVVPEEVEVALGPRVPELRRRTARGVLINSGFQVGLAGLGLLRNLVLAAFLTTSEFGLMGLIVTTMITITFLKQVGVTEKYVQQDEADQELAFQRAFGVEVVWSAALLAVVVVVVPLYGFVIYDRPEIVVPTLVLALVLPATALQSPIWVSYRDMEFLRQRLLEAIDPVIGIVVSIVLAIAGFGYWSLVIGAVAGALVGAGVALATARYPVRWRIDRGALRDYFDFSWPLLVLSVSSLIVVQGALIVGNWTVGLTGIAAIGLAGSFAVFADRLDQMIRRTIYPAVCAVKDRRDLMFEAFVKSNRLALMWGLPFGIGLALFAPDLVTYVLGERWRSAVSLMQVFGLIIGFRQVAFNWSLFMQAIGRTRPMAINGLSAVVVFAIVTAPLMAIIGVEGYAIGMAVTLVVDLVLRAYFLSSLFTDFSLTSHILRAVSASVPAVIVVLAIRALPIEPSLAFVLAQFAVYVLVTAVTTWFLERALLREITDYLRGKSRDRGVGAILTSPA